MGIFALPVLVGFLPGCQTIGGIFSIFIDPLIPPKVIAAEHEMADKQILIWVDDAQGQTSQMTLLRRQMTEALGAELVAQQAAGEVVSYDKIARFRTMHPAYAEMSIEALGQAFDVDEVLYVFVRHFSWDHDAGVGFYEPQVDGYLKVIDVRAGGQRLWPENLTQQVFQFKQKMQEGYGQTFENNLLKSFGQTMAQQLALYFYEHREKKS